MKVQRGSVVRSTAGHDKGSFFAVLSCSSDTALLSNGVSRLKEKPKKKKLLHLSPTKTVLPEETLHSNQTLREALRPFCGKGSFTPEEADL